MNCVHCGNPLHPSLWERFPDGWAVVSFTCKKCSRVNRVQWSISIGLMFVSALVAFSCMALAMQFWNLPEFIAIAIAISILYGLFLALLTYFLRHSPRPFSQSR